ncbi:AMP-binding protein [Caenimonas aquaedulcis]|uniref:AMP-binding protein n=1 Tax=Caenimonas aquaedulcis TaxID=2793270 RepID=A0A931H849_9BURK|nr:AMP-binding protein [Caenimonas aquaedulcis]MBG9390464.1 AMP-binding protein [Caenimonas aquaedulcis]
MQSLFADFSAAWQPGATFLRTPGGRSWTYGELDEATSELAARLSVSLGAGDRLVSMLERSEWNIFLYLACTRCGVVYVPLNPRMTPAELGPVIADADPSMLVCDPVLQSKAEQLVEARVLVRTLDRAGGGSLRHGKVPAGVVDRELDAPHPAAIIFTSGTTGTPKGALIPHALFIGKARALAGALRFTSSDCLLHAMPLYHSHGLFMTVHAVLSVGASILFLPKFDAGEVVRALPDVTMFSGVPTMYTRLASEPGLKAAAAAIRLFICGSAPLKPELFEAFQRESGHRLVEVWGMSETMTNTASPLGDRRAGSAGKALPGVLLRVVDDRGVEVPPDTAGVIEVGFTAPFGGYWRRPPEEQPRMREGRLVTGDIGQLSPDGYLTILGRTTEMIISGGYNVYPREVELALEEMPGVAKAAVFAVPHKDFGEAVVAAVESNGTSVIDAAVVLRKLRDRLVPYKIPKALFIEDMLPTTELGKLQRKALAGKYRHYFR